MPVTLSPGPIYPPIPMQSQSLTQLYSLPFLLACAVGTHSFHTTAKCFTKFSWQRKGLAHQWTHSLPVHHLKRSGAFVILCYPQLQSKDRYLEELTFYLPHCEKCQSSYKEAQPTVSYRKEKSLYCCGYFHIASNTHNYAGLFIMGPYVSAILLNVRIKRRELPSLNLEQH